MRWLNNLGRVLLLEQFFGLKDLYQESGEVLNSCPERLWMPRPPLEVFKARLDGTLGSLGWYYMWRLVALPVVGGWSLMILEVPSNPSHSVIEKPSFCHGADCCPFH